MSISGALVLITRFSVHVESLGHEDLRGCLVFLLM